mmetsp:Transcript_3946/g.7612  ORF Transcript_3946/g.7612 Transcript_3946/m.7612 type:complete len:105 (+) Transcript_3946:904-1218(+)
MIPSDSWLVQSENICGRIGGDSTRELMHRDNFNNISGLMVLGKEHECLQSRRQFSDHRIVTLVTSPEEKSWVGQFGRRIVQLYMMVRPFHYMFWEVTNVFLPNL